MTNKIVIFLIDLFSSKRRIFKLYLVSYQLVCLYCSTSINDNKILLFEKKEIVVFFPRHCYLFFVFSFLRLVKLINHIADEFILVEVPLDNAVLRTVGQGNQRLWIRTFIAIEGQSNVFFAFDFSCKHSLFRIIARQVDKDDDRQLFCFLRPSQIFFICRLDNARDSSASRKRMEEALRFLIFIVTAEVV